MTDRRMKNELDDYERRAVQIDPLRLHEGYIALPADLAHWNARYAEAYEAFLRADADMDRTRAKLSMGWRARLAVEQGKVTEAQIAERVETDPAWEAAQLRAIEAEGKKLRLRGVVDAILAKKDMLISLGAHVRKEMEHNPSLRMQSHDAAQRAPSSYDTNEPDDKDGLTHDDWDV